MNVGYVVVVPSRYPRQFMAAGIEAGKPVAWAAEYPNANIFRTITPAKAMAAQHPGAQVYRVDDYESGAGPCHVVPS